MIELACAFGTTVTLPLVYLSTLLPGPAYQRAVGYTAVFLTGWSPLLWSYGFRLLGGASRIYDESTGG